MIIQKKEFYYLRHGQTDHNKAAAKTDHGDIPLNETGRAQAQTIEDIIAALPVKTVCCSPLRRAQETKEIVTKRLQANHVDLAGLTECTCEIWSKMTALGPEAHLCTEDPVKSFMQQVRNGVNQALSQEGPVLIVAHGGIHWAMCCLMGIEHEWKIGNCVPVHFTLGENGKWLAKTLTNTIHI